MDIFHFTKKCGIVCLSAFIFNENKNKIMLLIFI